jgi:hypothetical protein
MNMIPEADILNRTKLILLVNQYGPDITTNEQKTALHLWDDLEVVQWILDKGINQHALDYNGRHALFYPKSLAVTELLLQYHVDPTFLDHDEKNILFTDHPPDTLKLLVPLVTDINQNDEYCRTPLMYQANTKLENTKILIEGGANVNCTDVEHETPLHWALTGEIAELLIANGADVYALNTVNQYPMHSAEREDVVRVLLKYSDNMDRYYDVLNTTKDPGAIRLLLRQGINPHQLDYMNNSSLMFQTDLESIILLLDAGVNPLQKNIHGTTSIASNSLVSNIVTERSMRKIRLWWKRCKWYRLARLVKSKVFCEWYYAPDNTGGIRARNMLAKL